MMWAANEVGQRGHNCAQIHNIIMQFLNVCQLLYRTARHVLPVMLLEVNLACLSFHSAPYEGNVYDLTKEL
jgi:hypothetical protein